MNAMINTLKSQTAKIALPGIIVGAKKFTDAAVMGLPAAFLGLSALLESGYTGYNRISNTVSELVWGPNGWLETCLFVLAGFVLPLLAWRLYLVLSGSNTRKITAALLGAMGMAFITIAIFPTTSPDSAPDMVSAIHERSAQLIAFLFPCACALTALGLKNDPRYAMLYTCSLIAAGLGLLLNIAGLVAIVAHTEWLGAAERAVMMNGFIWLGVTGYNLWQSDCGQSKKSYHGRTWLTFHPAHTVSPVHIRHSR
jgi:hypothetical protein